MTISTLARSIAESPTFALNEEARLLRERGQPVINMGIGEPKNKTPITAILSSAARLTEGNVKYTPPDGTPSLKKAVIHYTEDNYEVKVAPENVIISAGAKQSLFNILFSICNPRDEVIVLAPYWVSYPEMIKMLGAFPVVVTPGDGSFIPSFDEITRAVNTNTKAIIVNSPNNPSGMIFPEGLIAQIVDLCEARGIFMICDDIYHKLVFDGRSASPSTRHTKRGIDHSNIVLVNGVAKTFGMTGFRVGWTVATRKLVAVMTNVQSQTTTCVSPLTQAAAEGAINGSQTVVESLRFTIQNNRDVLLQEFQSFNDVKCRKPEGTFYALPDFSAYCKGKIITNSEELAKFILNKARVVTVPGKEFGMEGHLRISYAGSVKDIIEGVERMKWALDPSAPSEIYIGKRKYLRDWRLK